MNVTTAGWVGRCASLSLLRSPEMKISPCPNHEACYEKGLSICSDELLHFREAVLVLEGYWRLGVEGVVIPDGFLTGLRTIILAIDKAIHHGGSVVIG